MQNEDEISLTDTLFFLKANTNNVVVTTSICLLLGALYYFSVPNMYEATASIQIGTIAGELIEAPATLQEKIKLPLFFSPAAVQTCEFDSELSSNSKFADKIKPTLNKSAQLISFTTQASSSKVALACLDIVISEIQKSHNEITKPLIEHKKQKLAQLGDQLKFANDVAKSILPIKVTGNATDTSFHLSALAMLTNSASDFELTELKNQIKALENQLLPPNTMPTSLVAPVYASEAPLNKRPLFTFCISLALGVFLGLLISRIMRVAPEIRKQIHEAEKQ